MTVIAYRNGQMSADRQITYGTSTRYLPNRPKIARDSNGNLYGCTGNYGQISAMIDAVQQQSMTGGYVNLPIPAKGDEFSILVAFTDGRIRHLVDGTEANSDGVDFIAIGSGHEFALGAMHVGASAQLAVEAAICFEIGCGGEIDVLYHPAKAPSVRSLVERAMPQVQDDYPTAQAISKAHKLFEEAERIERDPVANAEDDFMEIALKKSED